MKEEDENIEGSIIHSIEKYEILCKINDLKIGTRVKNSSCHSDIYLGAHKNQFVGIKIYREGKKFQFLRQKHAYSVLQESEFIVKGMTLDAADVLIKNEGKFKKIKKAVIILQYCSKATLFQYAAYRSTPPISPPTLRRIARMIIGGIRSLDEKGIGHRDLKLQNILVDDDFELKLFDFGHSQISKQNSNDIIFQSPQSNTTFGTKGYHLPQIRSNSKYTLLQYDLFTFGIMLFILYTKKYPFKETFDEKYELFLNNNQQYWRQVSEQVEDKGIIIESSFKSMINGFLGTEKKNRAKLSKLVKYQQQYQWFKGKESTVEQMQEEMRKIYQFVGSRGCLKFEQKMIKKWKFYQEKKEKNE